MTTIGYPQRTALADGPPPGVQWQPSNGTEGMCFLEAWCSHCARDKVMNGEATQEQADAEPGLYCDSLSASFRDDGTQDWRTIDGEVRCIRFVPQGEAGPVRCPNTLELPL